MEKVEALLIDILKGFVTFPDEISVNKSEQTDEIGEFMLFEVHTNPADIGVCIGKAGSMAEALRRVLGAVAYKQTERRIGINIYTPRSESK